jgi:spermidine dehydrogenase
MALSDRDKTLGMDRPISRRDFLNGVALTVTAAAMSGLPHGALAATPLTDPAKESGLRGHSEAAMNVMHAVRDGTFWNDAPAPEATGEHYDLVVVGGGISGLTAALLYRQQKPDAKVLILENNEGFGGHAVRNEFIASDGKTIIGYGGSQSLQTPSFFSPLVNSVLADIGIEPKKFEEGWYDGDWFDRVGVPDEAQFFDKGTFGADALVTVSEDSAWLDGVPLSDKAKADRKRITDEPEDYLPGKSREEKLTALAGMTYVKFLEDLASCDPQVALSFPPDEYLATTADCYPAIDAWAMGYPGFDAMDLGDAPVAANMPSARLIATDPDEYIYHFPDGNASVARALVRKLVPAALPGTTTEDLVAAEVNYGALDLADNPVRLRLGASVVKVAHDGDLKTAEQVTLTYFEAGKLKTVTAGHTILACWHRVIPHITAELGEDQIAAFNDQVKTPLVYANVLIRNFEAFAKLGIWGFTTAGNFWGGVALDEPVSIGDYSCPQAPSDPVLLHVWSIPGPADGTSARDQSTAGRYQLTTMAFEDFERGIRDLLQRALGPAGFDAATDIEAITVNRWSHGYSLEYMRPWDPYWPAGPLPIETARQGWGRIAIANADSGAYAYAHSAMDQAGRAVNELVGGIEGFSTFPGPPADVVVTE